MAGRRTGAAVGILLAVAAAVALRAGAEPVQPRAAAEPSERDTVPPGGLAAGMPAPPYDRLPGRTPIPDPTLVGRGDRLGGPLPATGPLGRPAAYRSARLVLGRYCRRPDRYAVAVSPEPDWRQARARAVRIDRSSDAPWIVLELIWTGRAYGWTGRAVQLRIC